MSEPLILHVTVHYKGMHSALEIDITGKESEEEYLDMIRQHIRIAQIVIDKRLEAKGDC